MTSELFKVLGEESKISIINAHPLGIGTASDVANACIYLLSDASKWITGTNLIIDGGYSAK
jgi:NAD(P)-dependent dehydrogenase (short-subunit alcohol dehydrogenase family)